MNKKIKSINVYNTVACFLHLFLCWTKFQLMKERAMKYRNFQLNHADIKIESKKVNILIKLIMF